MNIRTKLKNILKENKGVMVIETAIVSIIIIICICGIVDLNSVMKKHNSISTTATYISRVVSKQGGVRTSPPDGYYSNYVTSQELFNNVQFVLNKAGIKNDDWDVYINDYKLSPNSYLPVFSRGESIKVSLKAKYKWSIVSQLTPIRLEQSKTANRNVVSTFKNRTSNENRTSIE